MKKARIITVAILVCVLLTALTVPVLSEEVNIEALIELFISDPSAGIDQLLDLATTNPEAVALVLAGVAERAPNLVDQIQLTCIALMDVDPAAAALAVVTIKDRVPEIGERVEMVAVAAGLERSYLRAASPVAPPPWIPGPPPEIPPGPPPGVPGRGLK